MRVNDEWLYKYMPVVDDAMIRVLEENVDKEYQFSKAFEKKMKHLIRKEKYLDIRVGAQKAAKKVAIFVLILAAVMFTVTMSVEALRNKFFEVLKTTVSDAFLYTYSVEGEEGEFAVRKPGYIPEGYELKTEEKNETMYYALYEKSRGGQITFMQMFISEGQTLLADSEYDYEENIEICGKPARIYRYNEGAFFAYLEWRNNIFTINGCDMNKGEIQNIYLNWLEE